MKPRQLDFGANGLVVQRINGNAVELDGGRPCLTAPLKTRKIAVSDSDRLLETDVYPLNGRREIKAAVINQYTCKRARRRLRRDASGRETFVVEKP